MKNALERIKEVLHEVKGQFDFRHVLNTKTIVAQKIPVQKIPAPIPIKSVPVQKVPVKAVYKLVKERVYQSKNAGVKDWCFPAEKDLSYDNPLTGIIKAGTH